MAKFGSFKNSRNRDGGGTGSRRGIPNGGSKDRPPSFKKGLAPAADAADVFSVTITAGEDGAPAASPAQSSGNSTSGNDAKE